MNQIRIISGSARGRKLNKLTGNTIQPTSDKVKESVFNIIQFDIEGRKMLDLFAGTGQYGIEALSRGARHVVFVDTASLSVNLVKDNLRLCGFMDKASVFGRDALRFLEDCDNFDLIFIDPPYDSGLASKALEKIASFDKLNINGIIIAELKADTKTPEVAPPYIKIKEYKYGGVKIVKYIREDDLSNDFSERSI